MTTPAFDINSEEVQSAIALAAEARAREHADIEVAKQTEGLLSKRDELLIELKAKKEQLSSINSKYNFDEIDASLEEARILKQQSLTEVEKWEQRKGELVSQFGIEKAVMQALMDKKDAALRVNLIDARLGAEIAAAGGEQHLLHDILRKHIDVVPEGDTYAARIMKDGNPRLGGADGSFMTIAQLVGEFKLDTRYGACFKASGASGGGAESGSQQPKETTKTRSEMSVTEKVAYINANSKEEFFKLPA